MYSWYSPHASWYSLDVLNIPDILIVSPHMHHDIPNMHHDILPMYWTYIVQGGDVAHIALLFYFPMYSWYSPHASSYPLDVLNVPDLLIVSPPCIMMSPTCIMIFSRCPAHTLYRVEMSPILSYGFTSQCTHDIPHMHHHIHSIYWTSLMYLWYLPTCIMISRTCIMIFSRCTERTLYRVEMSPILRYCFTSRRTHDIPHMHHHIHSMYWTSPMYLWYPPTCIMISLTCIMIFSRCTEHTLYRVEMSPIIRYCFTFWCIHDIPHMHHHIHSMSWTTPMYLWYLPTCIMISPHASWYSPDVLNIHCTGWRCRPYCVIVLLPDVLMIFPTCIIIFTQCTEHPRCTYGIPPHASWYPPHASWYSPDVLNIHCTGWRCHPYCVIVLLPDVLMIFPTCIIISTRCTEHPRCPYGIPPHPSWYPPHASWYSPDVLNIHCTGWRCRPYCVIVLLLDVLMIFPTCIIISTQCTEHPGCTYGIPHMHHDFSRCNEHTLYRVEMSPILHYCFTSLCTHDIPHMHHDIHSMYWTSLIYLLYPPTCIMISLTCIMIFSRCTEHTLYRVEMSPILRYCFTSPCTHDIPRMHHHIHSMYWTSPIYLLYPPHA